MRLCPSYVAPPGFGASSFSVGSEISLDFDGTDAANAALRELA